MAADNFEDVYFGGIPPQLAETMKNLSRKINPHRQERQGRKSAEPVLDTNRARDNETADAVLHTAMSFSEFQELGLYHPNGYFARRVDYQKTMPLLPQLLSPFFGMMAGELAFAHYVNHAYPYAPSPVFLGLGAGRGYMDRDLIDHVTSESFQLPGYDAHAKAVRERSTFLITDKGEKAVSLARKELSEITSKPRLRGRVRIEELDAMDFNLGGGDFGIVYANELIDNLPTEPIVSIDGVLHGIKVAGFNLAGISEDSAYVKRIERGVPSVGGIISKEQVRARADANDTDGIGFAPVFVPLEYDRELEKYAKGLSSAGRINDPDFGGIYPIHTGLDGLFGSVKRSFNKGVLILIDYVSLGEGMHNWNIAVNRLRHYRFGEEDMDFQLDTAQVVEKAGQYGMRCEENAGLDARLKQMLPLAEMAGVNGIKRWSQAQGRPFSDKTAYSFAMTYAGVIQIASGYNVMSFHF